MRAVDILMDEHRVIERVIGALERACDRLERGEAVRPGFFLDAAEFIRGFADGTHHRKEEGLLFPAMVDAGLPGDSGPIGVMLTEHEAGRAFTRAIREAAGRLGSGDAAAAGEILRNARGYASLLREHIRKEDNILFPMAERLIPEPEISEMVAKFRAADSNARGADPANASERFLALAETLVAEAGGA